jgi:hypothetical protein
MTFGEPFVGFEVFCFFLMAVALDSVESLSLRFSSNESCDPTSILSLDRTTICPGTLVNNDRIDREGTV